MVTALAAATALSRPEMPVEPVSQLPLIGFLDHDVLDLSHSGHKPRFETGLPLGRIKWFRLEFPAPQEVDQAFCAGQHVPHRLGPTNPHDIVRIHAVRQEYEEQC